MKAQISYASKDRALKRGAKGPRTEEVNSLQDLLCLAEDEGHDLIVLQLGAVCVGLWEGNCAKVLLCWCDGKCVRQLNI